jgi:hypothetical protein
MMEAEMTTAHDDLPQWAGVYRLGGAAALGAVLAAGLEILITFLPGGDAVQVTVQDWFALFAENWFLGLRNLGLINILINSLGVLAFFALYAAHRRHRLKPYAALALIIASLGIGIFFATNRAFPMLALSNQYNMAGSEAERMVLEAAGKTLLAVGQSHTPGTFFGFFLTELAGVLISVVMLRSMIFSRSSAYAGLLGFGLLLIFEIIASFSSGLSPVSLSLAMVGGLFSMAWYVLIARRLFQLARGQSTES